MDEATGSELSADEISNAMEGYISVTPGEELTFHKEITEGYFRWHLYDESQVYISSENNLENLFTWIVPDGVNYIRVSYPNTGNVKDGQRPGRRAGRHFGQRAAKVRCGRVA